METIKIHLDEQTLGRARQLAERRHCSLEELITGLIEQLGAIRSDEDALIGMLADEPEVMDQVVESAMKAREEHPLRQSHG